MNRRDFLLFRTSAGRRVVELSCEQLYMNFIQAQARVRTVVHCGGDRDHPDPDGCLVEHEPISQTSEQDLFSRLDAELQDVRELCLFDTAWLSCEDLNKSLDKVLSAFRGRGGRILLRETIAR